jgi:alkylation response protein AidB-like acyl-CoA dehydrogenase
MAAPVKLALTDAEQRLHDLYLQVHGDVIALGSHDLRVGIWQDDWYFSRAVSIYGGTRQMQLATIAKHTLGLGSGT